MSLQEEEPPTSATFCCPVCCEDAPTSEITVFISCAHKTCRRCAVTWIEKAEASGQQSLPGCPWCRVSLTPEETETLLGRPFRPREALQAPSLDQLDDLTRQWLEEETQACAGCGSRVEKVRDGGCNLMECLCGYRWCWNCGSPNARCGCTPAHHYFWDNLMNTTAPRAARPRAHRNAETGEIDWRQHVRQRLKERRSLKVRQERKNRRIRNAKEARDLDRPTSAAIWLFQASNPQSGLRMLSEIVQTESKRTDRHKRRNGNDVFDVEDWPDQYGSRWLYDCKGAGSRWLDYITTTDVPTQQRARQKRQVRARREILEADASVLAAHWMFSAATGWNAKMLDRQTRPKAATTNPLCEPKGVLVPIVNGTWLFQRKDPFKTRLQLWRLFRHLDRERRCTRFNQRTPVLQPLVDRRLEGWSSDNAYWLFGSEEGVSYPTIRVGNTWVQVGRPVVAPTHLVGRWANIACCFGTTLWMVFCCWFGASQAAKLTGSAAQAAQLTGNAVGLPFGSYLESCGGCQVTWDGALGRTQLACSACSDTHGATYASTLILESCLAEGNDIGNENGKLACEKPPLPGGAYSSSCFSCSLTNGGAPGATYYLRCFCWGDDQQSVRDTILYPPLGHTNFGICESIENQNGELVCNAQYNPETLPRGRYKESCPKCQLIDRMTEGAPKILMCRCSNEEGGLELTVLQLSGGDCVDIDNQKGELICVVKDKEKKGGGGPALPKGKYKASCMGCTVDIAGADTHRNLACVCWAEDRTLRYSMLQFVDGACEDIDNQNGELVFVKPGEQEQDIDPEVIGESESSSVVDELKKLVEYSSHEEQGVDRWKQQMELPKNLKWAQTLAEAWKGTSEAVFVRLPVKGLWKKKVLR